MPLPDLYSLALFVRTVDTNSLSKAAEQAHISLSAASRRIALLEDTHGVQLLTRTSRGVCPTPAGEALAFHARFLLRAANRLVVDLSDYAKGSRGLVRLFANTSALTQYLPNDLASFAQNSSDIKIEVRELLSSEIIAAIKEGDADIGIAFLPRAPLTDVSTHLYRTDRLVAVVPDTRQPQHESIEFAALLDCDLVVLESSTAMLSLLEDAAASEGKPLRIRAQVKSFEAICMMIGAGLGIGILPEAAANVFISEFRLRLEPLRDSWAVRQMHVLVRQGPQSPTVNRVLAHLCPGTTNRDGLAVIRS